MTYNPVDHPFIKKVVTNVKGHTAVDLEVSHLFFYGGNGSGKTSLINAITLALTGTASDLGFRDAAAAPAMLAKLLPAGETELYAEVHLSDETVCRWSMIPGHRPKLEVPKGFTPVLVYDVISDVLRGSVEKAALFLYDYFISDTAVTDKRVTSVVQGAPDAAVYLATAGGLPPKLKLRTLYLSASTARSNFVTERNALTKAIDALGGNDAAPTPQQRVLGAMEDLLSFQIAHPEAPKCGVCGHLPDAPGIFEHRLREVTRKIEKAGRGSDVAERILRMETTRSNLNQRIEELSNVEKACLEAMVAVIRDAKKPILRELFDVMPEPRVDFELTSSSFTMGIVHDNVICPAASGGEWAMVVTAWAGALARRLPAGAMPVLVLPDRSFDTTTLRHAQSYLRALPGTVIIQNAYRPRGRPVAGWQTVQFGDPENGSLFGG